MEGCCPLPGQTLDSPLLSLGWGKKRAWAEGWAFLTLGPWKQGQEGWAGLGRAEIPPLQGDSPHSSREAAPLYTKPLSPQAGSQTPGC